MQMLTDNSRGALTAPIRNRYFYGKLLDVRSQEMEQAYGMRMRRLLNRFGLGTGVLCGLEVHADGDGQVWIDSGMAVDGCGREILVTEPRCVPEPWQPVDACGDPDGDPVGDGTVTICLAYHECDVDPVPVLVEDCDTREGCRPGAVRERYRVLIRAGEPETWGGLTSEQCGAIFPAHPAGDFDRRAAACQTLAGPCADTEPLCVPIATLVFAPEQPVGVRQCVGRTTVYSNARLFDMLLCLAARMDACCAPSLHYVSGDAQTAMPGGDLEAPVVVEVRDHDDRAVPGEPVTFRALGGAGQVDDGGGLGDAVTVDSGADGRAQAHWRLGPAAGLNTLEATIAGGGRIAFHALSSAPVSPPFVEQVWPPNGAVLGTEDDDDRLRHWDEQWRARPRIEIAFDREMDAAELASPDSWLRLWRIHRGDDGDFTRERMELVLLEPGEVESITTDPGWRAAWGFVVEEPQKPARWLLQIRASEPEAPIHEAGAPHLLLDPDFNGTQLPIERLREIFEDPGLGLNLQDWKALSGGGSLDGPAHSGDGSGGGELNLWFETGKEEG